MQRFPRVLSVCCLATIVLLSVGLRSSQAGYCDILLEDLNGDGKVDIYDVTIVARAYGSFPGHESWEPSADIVPDGKINIFDVVRVAVKLGLSLGPSEISTHVQVKPRTLNMKSNGRWITVIIKLPNMVDAHSIDVSSIVLNETVFAELRPFSFEERKESELDLTIKFDRQRVIGLVLEKYSLTNTFDDVTLTVTGSLNNGTLFRGSDTIRVINLQG